MDTDLLFYWFMRRFVDRWPRPKLGDLRLFGRNAVLAIRQFGEQTPVHAGVGGLRGLKEVLILVRRQERVGGAQVLVFKDV